VSTDQEIRSMPRLYGAPAHTPRRMATLSTETGVGPDDLPIETYRTSEDQALALQLVPRAYSSQVRDGAPPPIRQSDPTGTAGQSTGGQSDLRGKPLLLRALGGVLMRPKGH
jgi:hypothetical protein